MRSTFCPRDAIRSSSRLLACCLCSTILVASIAQAQEPPAQEKTQAFDASITLQAKPPQTPIKVGTPISLTYEVTHPAGAILIPPEGVDGTTRWGLVDAKIASGASKGPESPSTQSTLRLTLVPWRSGRGDVPPLEIAVTGGPTNETVVLKTPKIEDLRVVSTLDWSGDEPKLGGPRPPVSIIRTDYTLLWAMGGSGALLFSVLFTVLFMRRRARLYAPEPEPPAAHLVALEALSALASSPLFEQEQWQEYYIRLSEIVRDYLGKAYNFQGTELTTTEIMDVLKDKTLPLAFGPKELKAWLRACDRVKFTSAGSTQADADHRLRQAITLVELTRHQKEAEAKEAQAKLQQEAGEGRGEGVEEGTSSTPSPLPSPASVLAPEEPTPSSEEEEEEEKSDGISPSAWEMLAGAVSDAAEEPKKEEE